LTSWCWRASSRCGAAPAVSACRPGSGGRRRAGARQRGAGIATAAVLARPPWRGEACRPPSTAAARWCMMGDRRCNPADRGCLLGRPRVALQWQCACWSGSRCRRARLTAQAATRAAVPAGAEEGLYRGPAPPRRGRGRRAHRAGCARGAGLTAGWRAASCACAQGRAVSTPLPAAPANRLSCRSWMRCRVARCKTACWHILPQIRVVPPVPVDPPRPGPVPERAAPARSLGAGGGQRPAARRGGHPRHRGRAGGAGGGPDRRAAGLALARPAPPAAQGRLRRQLVGVG